MSIVFEDNFDADETSAEFLWRSGEGEFRAEGDPGGGTAKLQTRRKDSTNSSDWHDLDGASLTAQGEINFNLGICLMRVVLSGSTTPNLNVQVQEMQTRNV